VAEGYFGGTFDPIHVGHLDVARAAREALGLERVWLVPARVPPHRAPPQASAAHRFAMAALAIANAPGLSLSDLEQEDDDPSYTSATLDRLAGRLRKAADGQQRVLFATGHPGGLLDVHRATAAALRAAGCHIVVIPDGLRTDEGYVMQFADVAVLEHGATLWHTHSGEPMKAILTALEREGRPLPDLVVADHGWAGYAGQHGVDAVGYADCNDPALFIAEAEGTVQVTVPLDDHVISPRYYDPMTAYLLSEAGLSSS